MDHRVKPDGLAQGSSGTTAPNGDKPQPAQTDDLWRTVFSRENVLRALEQVERNKGAAGPDGMKTQELRPWLRQNWPTVRQSLDRGTFKPQPVRRVSIPKPAGGERTLGVPNVLDRMICQAIAQVLVGQFDPHFSGHSFGFRPGRSAHQAVTTAKRFLEEGYTWGIAIDLDSFFDRVQHDVLMNRVAARVKDKRLLKLIGSYLRAGVMVGGVRTRTDEGTPQGSPLSPVLSNIMLDDLDQELKSRGHKFVRYADDVHIYVRSRRAGERVFDSVATFVEHRLKLRVNRQKSRVDEAKRITLLGFRFIAPGGVWKIRIAPEPRERIKRQLRFLTRRVGGYSMDRRIREINKLVVGWTAYFSLAETPSPFKELDEWLRRRLRQVRWREWKRPSARRRNLRALGVPEEQVIKVPGWPRSHWRISHIAPVQMAMPNTYWQQLGLRSFSVQYERARYA